MVRHRGVELGHRDGLRVSRFAPRVCRGAVDAALVLEEPGDVKALLKLVTFVALALGAVGAVFLSGMRSKSPLVLNAVRRTGRATKGFVLPRARIAGSAYAVIRHVGRKSGRVYETPMQPVKTDDGFAVALPYGRN